jgi:hypothetical protein
VKFELIPPHVFFHDDKPGNHVTMFLSDGRTLPFRVESSRFDDRARRYAWAFDARDAVAGAFLVFATADREVVGILGGAGCVLGKLGEHVIREEGSGKPLRLVAPRASSPQVFKGSRLRIAGVEIPLYPSISPSPNTPEYPPGWPPPVLARDLE